MESLIPQRKIMKFTKQVFAIADKFEQIITKAQIHASTQSGDVEAALKIAGLFDVSSQVAPFLDQAKVPENASVDISIVVDKHLNPNYSVTLTPASSAAHMLANIIKQHYAVPMKKAFINARLNVADTLSVKWLHF